MKVTFYVIVLAFCCIILAPSTIKTNSFYGELSNNTLLKPGNYTVREFIVNKWYLVTYNEEGYVIDMIEDDE